MHHISSLLFLLLSLVINTQTQYMDGSSEAVNAELQITDLELQDDCENLAIKIKTSLQSNTFDEKIKVRKTHGELMKVLSNNVRPLQDELPLELHRNWTLFVHSGDALLSEQDWSSLVNFDVKIDELIHTETVHCKNGSQGCIFVKKRYDSMLEDSRNITLVERGWSAWQKLMSSQKNEFPNILNLVTKAALENGQDNAKAYWEMLTDGKDYNIADSLWEEIKPLYSKLQTYVRSRLFHFYNINKTESEIPVYLLGSNFGNDWSKIAGILLPHPQIYLEAEAYINKTKIEDLYKMAEELTQEISLGAFGNQFWNNSLFNMTFCENHLLSFCSSDHSELLTCDKTSWTSYLDAFETGIDICLRNIDYLTLSRQKLRYSVVDEALTQMGSTLAIKNLRFKGIWDSDLFEENPEDESGLQHNKMAELMLTALRTLPKLPFYLAADKWRLHLLENGFGGMEEEWWRLRKEYQGVEGVTNTEADFLADAYISSNRPYLSKFFGTILQFQLLEAYSEYTDESMLRSIAEDDSFLKMLQERSSMDWPSLIANHYSLYDLSSTAILDFFAPLERYLETAPLDQIIVTTTKKPPTLPPTVNNENSEANLLKAEHVHSENEGVSEEDGVTHPPIVHHEHIEENLEGPNPSMEKISMYIGIGLLVGAALIIVFVLVKKVLAKKKRSNNRRFET